MREREREREKMKEREKETDRQKKGEREREESHANTKQSRFILTEKWSLSPLRLLHMYYFPVLHEKTVRAVAQKCTNNLNTKASSKAYY